MDFAVMPMGDTEPYAQNRSIRMAGGVKQAASPCAFQRNNQV
jgi:hypothetical protein